MVPYAKDGTSFDKDFCRRPKGYQIGPKGAEEWVESYEEALKKLRNMKPAAYWRRPSATSDTPGIVTAVAWK